MITAEQPVHEQIDRYLSTYHDTATWLAETLESSMLTRFEYTYRDGELYSAEGSAMGAVFHKSVEQAEVLAASDASQAFELRRRKHEFEEYEDMVRMVRGELPSAMVVVSDFPPELAFAHRSVGGYNIERKQTMLRVLTWDGQKLAMISQSLDGSNRTALEKLYGSLGSNAQPGELLGQRIHVDVAAMEPHQLVTRLVGVYDYSLTEQFGGRWYAGRPDGKREHDTYSFVRSQHDVMDYFAQKFSHTQPAERDLLNIAALMEKRFAAFREGNLTASESDIALQALAAQDIDAQLQLAGNRAVALGRVYDGCGMSIGVPLEDQLEASGYGNAKTPEAEDTFGSRWFSCPKGHMNYRRVANRLEKNCQKCGVDVACEKPKHDQTKVKPAVDELRNSVDDQPEPKPEAAQHVAKKVVASVVER